MKAAVLLANLFLSPSLSESIPSNECSVGAQEQVAVVTCAEPVTMDEARLKLVFFLIGRDIGYTRISARLTYKQSVNLVVEDVFWYFKFE